MPFTPGTKGNFSAGYIALQPLDPVTLPPGSIALDATSGGMFVLKDTGGGTAPVTPVAPVDSLFIKVMQNLSGVGIPANTPVSKKPDGSITRSDSDNPLAKIIIGITMSAVADTDTGSVMLLGPNAVGVIASLGFTPGQAIYVSPSTGFTNDTNDFTIDSDITNDAIVRVGYADCAAGSASGVATDLILFAGVEAIG